MLWKAVVVAVGVVLLPGSGFGQAIDCRLYPLECPQEDKENNFRPTFEFEIKIGNPKRPEASTTPKPSPKPKVAKPQKKSLKAKPNPKAGKQTVRKLSAPLKKKSETPRLKKTPIARGSKSQSWAGLPVIAATTLSTSDLLAVPNQFMAVLNPEVLTAAGIDLATVSDAALAQALGLPPSQIISVQRRFVGSLVFTATAAQVQTLGTNSFILFLEEDSQIKAAAKAKPAKSLPLSWGLDRLDSPLLPLDGKFDRDGGNYQARVYLFDTRVLDSKQEFSNRISNRQNFLRGVQEDEGECRSHGTEMASLIAGASTGAAPRAELISLVVLPCENEKTGQASSLVEAAEWLLSREADHGDGKPAIANMSLSGRFSRTLNHVVKVLTSNRVAVIAAAGNESNNACRFSPGSAPEAVTVAATAPDDSIWSQSNSGPCIDVYAPGSLLTVLTVKDSESAKTTYAALDGTSGATALVTGLLARSMTNQGQVEAHGWLKETGVPGKLWRTDNLDLTLIQASGDWKNECVLSRDVQLWQQPLAIDPGPFLQAAENLVIVERRGQWRLAKTSSQATGWFIPRGELTRLDGSACE